MRNRPPSLAIQILAESTKERVKRAIGLDAKFKMLVLDDPDLEPLWKEIER
jgi:hypothetical protein